MTILSCAFEVYGIVQGVSFRMYTQRQANSLGIHGWCMNTAHDTVKGEIEGVKEPFEAMKIWLAKTGSPTSRIDKVVFSETQEIPDHCYQDFSIRQ